jgi:MoxR-like ATPase
MAKQGYVASDDLSMALHIALSLGRPLLLEGAAGVGKTDIARTLARAYNTQLIRLQCYEGLDAAQAIYEWNYQRQLLAIRAAAEDGETGKTIEARLFSEEYLLQRPLLQAIRQEVAPVLLIDEIDRADEEFEAYLLEVLSDFQITIPELGTIKATTKTDCYFNRQWHARSVRCVAAALYLCACRLSRQSDRTGHFASALSRGHCRSRSANYRLCTGAAQGRP